MPDIKINEFHLFLEDDVPPYFLIIDDKDTELSYLRDFAKEHMIGLNEKTITRGLKFKDCEETLTKVELESDKDFANISLFGAMYATANDSDVDHHMNENEQVGYPEITIHDQRTK